MGGGGGDGGDGDAGVGDNPVVRQAQESLTPTVKHRRVTQLSSRPFLSHCTPSRHSPWQRFWQDRVDFVLVMRMYR